MANRAITFREIEGKGGFYALLAGCGVFLLLGAYAYFQMEHHGHVITGMDNQIVWGMPHVIALFLIVAASGALNVASIASVFGKSIYKPLAPLSALLALALMAGGLTVLMLDLGRSDRMIIAATHFNFKSVFALNVFLYTGFFAIVGAYLWFMMERRMNRWTTAAGVAAFIWRLTLTTGTGSVFGFLVAREAYQSAVLAPLFIVLSFAYGTALFLLTLAAASALGRLSLGAAVVQRLKNLLATFVAGALYLVVVFHLTNIYFTRNHGVEQFILLDGGIITGVFWVGQILIGSLLPLLLLLLPGRPEAALSRILTACVAVVIGGLAQMYVTIIGGQAWPLDLFPGYAARSSFFDGEIHAYAPSLVETLLGLGGFAIAAVIVIIALKVLRLLPEKLDDATLDPQQAKCTAS
ncbi:MAG: molybdopterin oxidoreductase [Rhodocyclaceae bacterium]|nr:MAG: molybdopterin oxidoreductase [Rhodocyclaceae bacterium]